VTSRVACEGTKLVTMRRTVREIWIGALVWLMSIALVSGRVNGVLRASEEGRAGIAAPVAPVNASAVLWTNVLLIATALALTLAIVILLLMIRRVHRQRLVGDARTAPFVTTCPALRRADLEAACEDFSNIIGTSPDGVLYKGTLGDGTEVAVTSIRMSSADWSPNSELSFRRKVEGLARMKHKHLVNLLGYCSEEKPFTRMLVFEYASNGTLADHLQNPKEMEHLDWATRMRVIMGAAYGLEYMHHELTPPCSHLNFDASAIYLTDEYAAKIANFGIARMVAPKLDRKASWLGQVKVSYEWESSDCCHAPGFESNMYQFGVFLLQTVSGRPAYAVDSLVSWASEYLCEPKLASLLVDPELKAHNSEELLALCTIANECLSAKDHKRPSMRKVSHMLAEALKMTPEAATMKASPLLWAQLSILDDTA
jgi:serine/threonine protein kinase